MTLLRGHGLSIELPPGWEGRIFVPDLPPPAVNFPTLHATDRGITMSRSTFASELAERVGAAGTLVVLVEFDPALANVGLFERAGLDLPIPRDHLDPNALQIPNPAQEGHQRFFSSRDRAFCLYLVAGTAPGLTARLGRVNDLLATLEVAPLRRTA